MKKYASANGYNTWDFSKYSNLLYDEIFFYNLKFNNKKK